MQAAQPHHRAASMIRSWVRFCVGRHPMSTYRINLLARRDAIAAELGAIANKSNITDREEYRSSLYGELKAINELLNDPNSRLDASDLAAEEPKPFTLYEYGET